MWKPCTGAVLALLLSASAPAQPLPGPPKYPPPLINAAPQEPPAQALTQRFHLQPGWNAVSFPFSKTLGIKGFGHGLISGAGKWSAKASDLQPGAAYWAYSDRHQEGVAWGEPQTATTTLSLAPGWNFIGSPHPVPLDFSQVTFGDGQQVNRVVEEAARGNPAWLDAQLFSVSKDHFEALDLMTAKSQMLPGRGYWLYAYKPLSMRLNVPSEVPVVRHVERGQGQEIILEGDNFGDPDVGRLVLNTHSILPEDILEWWPNRIRFRLPGSLNTQRLSVVSGGAASPRITEDRIGNNPVKEGEGAAVTLTVYNENGEPVPSAQVQIGSNLPVTTGRNGVAVIAGVTPGQHPVKISAPNFLPRTTKLTVPPNQSHRTTATLYAPRSTISVRATPCTGGWRPYKIEVWQKRNWRTRNYNTFPTDRATPYVELYWTQQPTNVIYCIEITWRNREQYEKRLLVERKLGYYGIQETFYNYWGYY
jgi:hypothetical protein